MRTVIATDVRIGPMSVLDATGRIGEPCKTAEPAGDAVWDVDLWGGAEGSKGPIKQPYRLGAKSPWKSCILVGDIRLDLSTATCTT